MIALAALVFAGLAVAAVWVASRALDQVLSNWGWDEW